MGSSGEPQQAMTRERLAEIDGRLQVMAVFYDTPSGGHYPDLAHDYLCDAGELRTEVERLRAREAALEKRLGKAMAIVQMVANRWPLFRTDRINELVEQARALLASAGEQAGDLNERSGGDGK